MTSMAIGQVDAMADEFWKFQPAVVSLFDPRVPTDPSVLRQLGRRTRSSVRKAMQRQTGETLNRGNRRQFAKMIIDDSTSGDESTEEFNLADGPPVRMAPKQQRVAERLHARKLRRPGKRQALLDNIQQRQALLDMRAVDSTDIINGHSVITTIPKRKPAQAVSTPTPPELPADDMTIAYCDGHVIDREDLGPTPPRPWLDVFGV